MQMTRVIIIFVALIFTMVPAVEAQDVVITIGARTTAAGFAGDDQPGVVFPTVIGYPKPDAGVMIGMGQKDFYVGDEAMAKRGMLDLVYPVRYGRIVGSTEEMKKLLHHVFYNELRVNPKECRVLVAISDVVGPSSARKILTLLFNEFNVEAAYIKSLAALSVYASGRTAALAVNMTHEGGNVVPVVAGTVLADYVVKLPRGIEHQALYMRLLLDRLKVEIPEKSVIEDIVITQTYVAADYKAELDKAENNAPGIKSSYVMDDGTTIELGKERFMVPESLFRPRLVNHSVCGLQRCIATLLKTVNTVQDTLVLDVVLSGTASLTPGLASRLAAELLPLRFDGVSVRVVAPPERAHSDWIGGSILASLSTFETRWVSGEEFAGDRWQKKLF